MYKENNKGDGEGREGEALGWRAASHYGILQTMTNIHLPSPLGGGD